MPRPGGNPALQNFCYTTTRNEPLKYKLQLRIPESMRDALKELDDPNEFVRQAITTALLHLESVETSMQRENSNQIPREQL